MSIIHWSPNREPDNPRQSMEPEADMSPDDARQFMKDIVWAIYHTMNQMPDDEFDAPDNAGYIPREEKAKQVYGNDIYQLLSGVGAALGKWEESGQETAKLKEDYGGKFVEGVEIGERLAVYQGGEFTFTDESSDDEDDSKFTFTE